jgi:predicted site-specific integrase-resolvase
MFNSGTIIVPDDTPQKKEVVAVYARVSSSENRSNLISQSKRVQEFCSANGWIVSKVVEECGSGLNDERKKMIQLLSDENIAKILVEHKDRITRFGS